ncbi:toll-Interleukin receptor [Nocardioides caricicola]|uniref:Toll-Interleukin receptor n=1 Tax=Nocardioides caricicola TaxID=634770 RepID=A0ABW0N310_9ACTN
MSYFTASDLRERAGSVSESAARVELSHMAKTVDTYDVFLSHSVRDAVLVLGLKKMLEAERLSVYVDWLEDPDLDRANVTPATARRLRQRMQSCRSLIYATSRNASASRWMPWELGYFDGHRSQSTVAICPIEEGTGSYPGEEYLGMYKRVEKVRHQGRLQPFAVEPPWAEGETMPSFVHGRGIFHTLTRK